MRNVIIRTMGFALLTLCPGVGYAGDGVVALQTADASCRTATTAPPRYVDCGNGTVTDNLTGLVWLADASCLPRVDWWTAMESVAGLADLPDEWTDFDCGLSDNSSPGEWRLPSAAEWETMIAAGSFLGCVHGSLGGPSITNDFGAGCWEEGEGSSFTGVLSDKYWASTNTPAVVYYAHLEKGWASDIYWVPVSDYYVWPVRGGQ